MKALKIYETLNFKRFEDPKESMGIGNEEFKMINAVDKELKPMGLIKTGPADMGSQSHYMRSLEEWKKPGGSKDRQTRVSLYFMNWYGIEKYQFSIVVNGYPIHFGKDSTDWYDFKNKWPEWTSSLEIIRMTELKPRSIIRSRSKYAISSKLHQFRYQESDIRKKDWIIEKGEEIQIIDIDFNAPGWGEIKVSFDNTYFICNPQELWQHFEIVSL